MKLPLLTLLVLVGGASAQLEGCSEATAAFTECAIVNCPNFDQACDPTTVDPDNCDELTGSCKELSSCCNNGACNTEIEALLATCALGVCGDLDCSGGASNAVTTPDEANTAAEDSSFRGCSESIAAFTDCTIEKCPEDVDVAACSFLEDADNCDELTQACTEVSGCCNNGACNAELEALLATCALGVCGDLDCMPAADPATTADPAATTADPAEDEGEPTALKGCTEATAAFTECAIQNCPNFDQACDPTNDDPDTCEELTASCKESSACCNNGACNTEIEALLATCGLGVCGDVDCSGGASDAVTTPDEANTAAEDASFYGCSESIAAFTDCTIKNCPDIDQGCDPTVIDPDNCSELTAACQEVSGCCGDNACNTELEALLATCALGVCGDLDCKGTGDTSTAEDEGEPTQLKGCTEATGLFTECAIKNCPDFDQACDPTNDDPDNCEELTASCKESSACCNNGACQGEIEGLLATCGLGVCGDVNCGGGSSDAVTTPDEPNTGAEDASFNGCSESIALFTDCTIKNCPDIDQGCDPSTLNPDNCDELTSACKEVSGCCGDNECQTELEALISTCALGVCGDLDCKGTPVAEDEMETSSTSRIGASLAGAAMGLAMLA